MRQLRLPTMGREFEKLADAAASNQTFAQFLLSLTEIELATRVANAVTVRIKDAGFAVEKDFDTYDFSVMPNLSKPKVLELPNVNGLNRNIIVVWWGVTGLGRPIWPWDGAWRRVGRVCGCDSSRGGAGQPPGAGAKAVHVRPFPSSNSTGRTC